MSAEDMRDLEEALRRDLAARGGPSGDSPFVLGSSQANPRPSLAAPTLVALPSAGAVSADVSFIADFALAAFSDPKPLQAGGHDPTRNGFNLQQLEMAVGAAVDPYFRLDANLVFSQFGVEIEEVYGTTAALPASLQVRAGQFLTRFGRFNPTHLHSWDMADQPLAWGKFFGGEGNRGLGVEASWLSPLPWYLEVVGSVSDAAGEATARSFLGGKDQWVVDPRLVQLTGAVKQFFPLSDSLSLSLGVSAALGPHGTGRFDTWSLGEAVASHDTAERAVTWAGLQHVGVPEWNGRDHRTEIAGWDLYLKFRPVGRALPSLRLPFSPWWVPTLEVKEQVVSLQAEAMVRRRQVAGGVLVDHGGYGQVFWRFAQRLAAVMRAEYVSGIPADHLGGDPTDPDWTTWRTRWSTSLNFWPTEFSRLRVQYNLDRPFYRASPIHAVFATIEFGVGAHGAHAF
jgi:hypothetical protein